jgi:predicted NAD/FAD-binding protein
MKIAIIGSGISGLTAFHLLRRKHDVTVFEAADWIGGHTHTVDVADAKGTTPVDTGFIVFNQKTYPNFVKLLRELGVRWKNSEMSFSVRSQVSGIEYNGTSLDTLFAQRINLARPRFLGMVRDILRFNRKATAIARGGSIGADVTLADFVKANRYSRAFVDDYIVPMGAAIWSAEPERMLEFPFLTFARFFDNHGMLTVDDRPQWLVIEGGSRTYVEALVRGQDSRIRTRTPISAVKRTSHGVEVSPANGSTERFDEVVIAAHSDQALSMLVDASDEERSVLRAIPYQRNAVTLHSDTSILPQRKKCWAAWNYHRDGDARLGVTYWMNRLQSLATAKDYCVTLNRDEAIAPEHVVQRFVYDHPIYTREGIAAQPKQDAINGVRHTWFCGAYFGYGFHEDGVNSALAVTRRFGESL